MAAHQAPLSLGFSRQEHWSGLPFPSPMHESEKWKWSHSVVSKSSQPHGLQPTRLLRPWDFPGKSTGVGCHCHLHKYKYIWGYIAGFFFVWFSCPLSLSQYQIVSIIVSLWSILRYCMVYSSSSRFLSTLVLLCFHINVKINLINSFFERLWDLYK